MQIFSDSTFVLREREIWEFIRGMVVEMFKENNTKFISIKQFEVKNNCFNLRGREWNVSLSPFCFIFNYEA
jgi:hypothetical protein